jgi:hypothetical protein
MLIILSYLIFLIVIKLVALSYMYSYLAGLHSGKYCVKLVINLFVVLHLLFLDFLTITS